MFRIIAIATVLFYCVSAAGLEDPTKPTSYRNKAGSQTKYRLESILIGPERRVAVINGRVVTEGEKIGAYTVAKIGNEMVHLKDNGRIITLALSNTTIRQGK